MTNVFKRDLWQRAMEIQVNHFSKQSIIAIALSMFAFLTTPTARAAQVKDYEINLDRPVKPGDTYRLTYTSVEDGKTVAQVAGLPPTMTPKYSNVYLVADVKVLAANKKGLESKILATVVQCKSRTPDGKTSEVVAPGTVLIAEYKGTDKEVKREDGQPLSEETAEALEDVLRIYHPDGPSEGDQFGTKDRKKIGDSWDANADQIIAALGIYEFPVLKQSLIGKTTLLGVRNEGGKEFLVVRMDCKADLDGEAIKPDPSTTVKGTFAFTTHIVVPSDGKAATKTENTDFRLKMTFSGQEPGSPEIVQATGVTFKEAVRIEPVP